MALALSIGQYYGFDSLVEFFILIISLLISYNSYKIYKVIKEKNYSLFSLAFLSISVAFVFKIVSNITLLNVIKIEKGSLILSAIHELNELQAINFFSFLLYKIFLIVGFLTLFLIINKTLNKESMMLYLYFNIITVIFSIYYNFIFHLTIAIILFSLTIHFYKNYSAQKNKHKLLVFLAFLIMFLSHLFFTMIERNPIFYITGEMFILVGFGLLLLNQRDTKNGKENKTRSYKRYTRSVK